MMRIMKTKKKNSFNNRTNENNNKLRNKDNNNFNLMNENAKKNKKIHYYH